MRSLYEINRSYLDVIENGFSINEETGEILFDESNLDALADEFNNKVDNIVCYIKDLDSLNEAIKAEKKALDERLKVNERKVENLKNYVKNALELRQMQKLETPRNKLSFRVSKSVTVTDESLIDDSYFNETIERKLDKKALLADLKDGKEISGCFLLEKQNLQIK